ncbi:MAG: signal recognition particle subunit [Geoglossum simile]|nr:MAG: signal recognition particle subunit [Geoglossum simile]
MSRHARIEEVSDSDSDPEVMDPSSFDPAQFSRSAIIPATAAASILGDPSSIPSSAPNPGFVSHADPGKYKGYQCLYPLYFDKRRSRAEGRRVGKGLAVENPLAGDIVDAAQELGMNVVFEPAKMHPKDWANPGRVRVLIKQDGKAVNSRVKNSECYSYYVPSPNFVTTLDIVQSAIVTFLGRGTSLTPVSPQTEHHLYILVSRHLLANPTTPASPLRLKLPNVPMPDPSKPIPPVAVPRGWKMGTILPIHSPALSGGGVSENFFKEMMGELQGQVEGGSSGGDGNNAKKKKKEKKKAKT